jgi:hypothetical protein
MIGLSFVLIPSGYPTNLYLRVIRYIGDLFALQPILRGFGDAYDSTRMNHPLHASSVDGRPACSYPIEGSMLEKVKMLDCKQSDALQHAPK